HTFRQFLHHSRTVLMHAVTHQDIPFDKLVEHTRPTRDPHTPPLIQTVFTGGNVTGVADGPVSLGTATMRPAAAEPGTAKFDLTVHAEVGTDAVGVYFSYARDLYEPGTMADLADSYRALVAAVLADPDQRLSTVEAVTEEQRRRLATVSTGRRRGSGPGGAARPAEAGPAVADRTDVGATEPEGTAGRSDGDPGCVPRLVTETARRQPDAVAVVDGAGAVTYRELDEWSNHLAHQLLRHGARPDQPIAVSLPPGTPAITAMLAVLKTGAAYLPIDPTAPPARRHHLITNSAVTILITEHPHDTDTPPGVVTLAPQRPDSPAPSAPRVDIHPEQLAYVIHTSGSTGTPKGVMVAHHALANLVRWHLDAYPSGPGEHHGQIASLGFDAAVWEIWPALVSGATLHVADPADRLDPAALHDWMHRQGLSVAFVPTPIAEAILRLPTPPTTRLRTLLTGGDALTTRPSARTPYALVNHYGPTEATVVATAGAVRPDGTHRPDLGGPIDGVRVLLLDPDLRLVPPGAPGELCIAGEGLARGYLGRPGQTAERFLPDPHATTPGSRLYRTGDLCRLRTDGTLEFLGRTDEQIAINGYRIEPGEIEATLRAQPHIEAAFVTTRQLPTGRHLIAYVTGTNIDTNHLRDTLHHTLPRHLVPHAILALPHLPLTRNGKIDRNALPTPDTTNRSRPPGDAVQRQLAGIWATVLGVPVAGLGVDDDFFAVGGHSLLATQVTAQAGAAFEVDLPVAALFRDPTIAGLAGELRRVERRPGWVDTVAGLREAVAALTEDQARRALAAATRPEQPYDQTGAPR
ncbi:non-ribosomal peptide synthetase, partial [Micromonospora echinofusca]|uniref:non-ribosomal peptide synthetase n=2 Tax=Micromonospora echinofusca TaxID=47858 RepID=UPI0033BFF5EC